MLRGLVAALVAVAFAHGTALAQDAVCPATPPSCDDTVEIPNPVYILTADTQQNLLKALGKKLRQPGTHRQMTLVYRNSSSCTNVSSLYNDMPVTSGTMDYIPANADWNEATTCKCNVTTTIHFQVASSAIFTESCGQTKPATVGLFRGPLQGYLFAVKKGSTQTAITADEAYFTFGFGNQGMVQPWNNEQLMFIRPTDASTLVCTMVAAGVPPNKAKGMSFQRTNDLLTAMLMPTVSDEAAIGLLGCAPYDRRRNDVKALAFKATGQRFAYYPDSTATATDKKNMRDGRYVPWSVTDWLAPVDGSGDVTDANADYLIKLILDKPVTPAPAFDPLDAVMAGGLVPECAMHVTRSSEGGDLSPYQSPAPCDCAFDKKFAPEAAAACVACTDDAPCGSGKCRHGWCEPR